MTLNKLEIKNVEKIIYYIFIFMSSEVSNFHVFNF